MRILTRMDIPSPTSETKTAPEEEIIETVRSDKSQATMANFFNGEKKVLPKSKKQEDASVEPQDESVEETESTEDLPDEEPKDLTDEEAEPEEEQEE